MWVRCVCVWEEGLEVCVCVCMTVLLHLPYMYTMSYLGDLLQYREVCLSLCLQ